MKIDAKGPGGNSFCIMGAVERLLKGAGREAEWPAILERMMSGTYAHLCDVAEEVSFGSIKIINRE